MNGPRSDNGEAIVSLTSIPLIIQRDYYDRQRPIVIMEVDGLELHPTIVKKEHGTRTLPKIRNERSIGDRHVYVRMVETVPVRIFTSDLSPFECAGRWVTSSISRSVVCGVLCHVYDVEFTVLRDSVKKFNI